MNTNSVKSATTAGLLGIFLGGFGAHNWYLGEKQKGIIHVSIIGGGILVWLIVGVILPGTMSFIAYLNALQILSIFSYIAYAAIGASAIWGLVEGIQILIGGDAGLAAKGYVVAAPMQPMGYGPQNFGYGPQNYPQQPQNFGPQQPQNFQQPQNNNGVNNGQQQ